MVTAPVPRVLRPTSVAHGVLLILLAAGLGLVGFHGARFARSCMSLDGARTAIETHIRGKYVRRMARVMKATDREALASGTDHYFRIGFSLLAGWQVASVVETSGLRYSLAPGRCSLATDGR